MNSVSIHVAQVEGGQKVNMMRNDSQQFGVSFEQLLEVQIQDC
jgi:hypothetical protein